MAAKGVDNFVLRAAVEADLDRLIELFAGTVRTLGAAYYSADQIAAWAAAAEDREKFKQLLFSENGIKIVNMLFFLAFLAHNLVFLVVAYLVWILFLAFCIKKAASRTSRIIYGCFIAFAVVMVVLNVVPVLLGL